MKYTQTGNCPYCDSERGISNIWAMSPQGWANLKERHDAGHPENTPTVEPKKDYENQKKIENRWGEVDVQNVEPKKECKFVDHEWELRVKNIDEPYTSPNLHKVCVNCGKLRAITPSTPKKGCGDHRSKYGEAECLCCGKSFIEHGDKIVGSESSESLVGKTSPQSTPPTQKKPIHSLPEKIDLGEVIKGVDEEQQPRELFNSLENKINQIIDWLQAEKEK